MQIWEYLGIIIDADDHSYIRTLINPQKIHRETLYYLGPQLDLAKVYGTEGWEIVQQSPNRAYLFKRPLAGPSKTLDH